MTGASGPRGLCDVTLQCARPLPTWSRVPVAETVEISMAIPSSDVSDAATAPSAPGSALLYVGAWTDLPSASVLADW